jgi:hypothetical protein
MGRAFSTHTKSWLENMEDTWEDNIKRYLKEIGHEDVDWIHLAEEGQEGLCAI